MSHKYGAVMKINTSGKLLIVPHRIETYIVTIICMNIHILYADT